MQSNEVGSNIIPVFKMRKLGQREVKNLAQGHTANKWQGQNTAEQRFKSRQLGSRVLALNLKAVPNQSGVGFLRYRRDGVGKVTIFTSCFTSSSPPKSSLRQNNPVGLLMMLLNVSKD